MADQLAASFIGCYGSGVASTPTLDRLASEGTRFDRCYAHVPVCAPGRAAIFTGRSAEINGMVTNDLVLRNDNPTFVQVLRDSGYRTGGFGKLHLTPWQEQLPEDFACFGFDESVRSIDSRYGAWLSWIEKEHPDYYEMALGSCFPMAYMKEYGKDVIDIRPAWEAARRKHFDARRQASEWAPMYSSPLPAELQQTTFITNVSLDFMQRHTEQHPDKPFLCYVSYCNPHHPYDPPAPYDTMFEPADIPDPVPMAVDRYSCKSLDGCRDISGVRHLSADTIKKVRAFYHGLLRLIDDQVARIVDHLKESGQLENTIIVFTTDHGDMMGDHGFFYKGIMHYDSCARVPLIARGSGVQEGVSDRLTSSLDIFPTFCEWAGVDREPPLEGNSFASACRQEDYGDGWPAVTVEFCNARSIVTDDGWRLTVYDEDGEGQLFNLREDPREQNDLFRDPAWTSKLLELYHLHVRAYTRMGMVVQHRNLSMVEGRQVAYNNTPNADAGGFTTGLPDCIQRADAFGNPIE
jgi:arylsulfatase A-like enzyme